MWWAIGPRMSTLSVSEKSYCEPWGRGAFCLTQAAGDREEEEEEIGSRSAGVGSSESCYTLLRPKERLTSSYTRQGIPIRTIDGSSPRSSTSPSKEAVSTRGGELPTNTPLLPPPHQPPQPKSTPSSIPPSPSRNPCTSPSPARSASPPHKRNPSPPPCGPPSPTSRPEVHPPPRSASTPAKCSGTRTRTARAGSSSCGCGARSSRVPPR